MKDSARLAASIGIIDKFLNGIPLERAFSGWARRAKYAGSSDRVAIRDIIFCSIRCLRTYSKIGGSKTGRGIVIGYLLEIGKKPAEYFTGEDYAPEVLSNEESQTILNVNVESVVESEVDFPDWLIPVLKQSLGPKFKVINSFLRNRAPMFLRINSRKASLKKVQSLLSQEDIETEIVSLVSGALEVKRNNRKVKLSKAYKNGYVEFQDINSQLACELIPISNGFRVLDFCAGGGGKALALKDRAEIDVSAFDIKLDRMKDIPIRSKRAGVKVKIFSDLKTISGTDFDLVLCDVPCTGSGAWRRDPEGKWSLTYDKYNSIQKDQISILNSAKRLVKEGGILVYMTCSFLKSENEDQIKKFLVKNTEWDTTFTKNLFNSTNGDGFFIAILRNNSL